MRTRALVVAAVVGVVLACPVSATAAVLVNGVHLNLTEGVPFTGQIATFEYDCGATCPAASAFTATVNQGSNTAVSELDPSEGVYSVRSTLRGLHPGQMAFLQIKDPDGDSVYIELPVTVVPAPLSFSFAPLDVPPGQLIQDPVTYSTVGYGGRTTLKWGDGTESECDVTVVLTAGIHTPRCSHVYENPGTYTMTARVDEFGTVEGTSSGTALVEPLRLSVTRPRKLHLRPTLSFVVTPTVAATLDLGATLLIPGGPRHLYLIAKTTGADHDQSGRLVLHMSKRQLNAVRAAFHRHVRPSIRLDFTGDVLSGSAFSAWKTVRIPFSR